ncbi:hypothetical protein GCM10009808_06560 [Microbacterium sediminicola]|uniref:4-hydroxybenzoate polyprenyltransferase n=1 Tax=Microbacterium sediminicola TaxID=415210 RepID=A0ABN2HRA7_9MICO
MTIASLVLLAAEESEHHGNVALETFPYFILAIVVFALLAFVTSSYRNVANRHAHKAEAYAKSHAAELQRSGHGH